MNSNKIKYSLIFALSMYSLIACSKFLDKKEDSKKVVPTTLSDLQAIMDNSFQTEKVSPSLSETSTDDYFLTTDIYNSLVLALQQAYTWEKYESSQNSGNDWLKSYQAIYYDNLTLEVLNKIERTKYQSQQWDMIKGSALFFRSYHFLNLLWQYAKAYDKNTSNFDLGIVLKFSSDFNEPSVRATIQQSYDKIIQDIKNSIPKLPSYPAVLTRPSKGAAYGLLARTYLSMRDYQNALLYADSTLQLNPQLINFNHDNDIITNSLDENAPFKQFNKETILYCEMSGSLDLFTNYGYIDSTLMQLYDSNDLRKIAYFKKDNTSFSQFKASYSGNTYTNFTGIATDEIYLIRAECYIREGKITNGLNDINTLLKNRYIDGTYKPISNLSKKEALQYVLTERRKELIFRGNRWIDIKRLNKEGANIIPKRNIAGSIIQLPPNDRNYALPIPDDIILITGMSQN